VQTTSALRNRHGYGKDGTRPVRSIAGDERAAHRLNEAARDGKAEASARLNLVLFIGAVELLKDTVDLVSGDAGALVGDFQLDDTVLLPGIDAYFGSGGRIFRGVVE